MKFIIVGAKPKWSPDIKHKTDTMVVIPDVPLRGSYQDLIATISLDPISRGYEAVVDVMGFKVKAWGLKIVEAKNELIKKVQELVKEMGWDVSPKMSKLASPDIRILLSDLPKHIQADIYSYLKTRPDRELENMEDVLEAYLTWNGIRGFLDDILTIVKADIS